MLLRVDSVLAVCITVQNTMTTDCAYKHNKSVKMNSVSKFKMFINAFYLDFVHVQTQKLNLCSSKVSTDDKVIV
jgi:hypothetical protein